MRCVCVNIMCWQVRALQDVCCGVFQPPATITSVFPFLFLSSAAFNSFSPLGRSQKPEIDVQTYSGLPESHVCVDKVGSVRGIKVGLWVWQSARERRDSFYSAAAAACARRGSVIEIEREMI